MGETSQTALKTEKFIELSRRLEDNLSTEQRSLDRLIITISSGGIILSFSTIPQALSNSLLAKIALITVWAVFALCILSSVASYGYSIKAYKFEIEKLDKLYRGEINRQIYEQTVNGNIIKARRANSITKTLFIASIAMLLLYGSLSLFEKENTMTNKKDNPGTGRVEPKGTGKPLDPVEVQKSSVEPANILTPEVDNLFVPQNTPDNHPAEVHDSQAVDSTPQESQGQQSDEKA